MKSINKIIWLENLRALACISVIYLHLSGPWLNKLQGVNINVWNFVVITHSISRFCVPVFLMITGVLLLKREYKPIDFYNNRMLRIIRPLLFWSFFYFFLFVSFGLYSGDLYSINDVVLLALNSILYGAAYHFWYLYLILSLYLIIPFFAKFYIDLTKKKIEVLLFFWVMILIFAQLFEQNLIAHYLRLLFGYFGYLILGNYIYSFGLVKSMDNIFAIIFLIFGTIFSFYPVYSSYLNQGIIASQWFYYLNINVVLISIGIFLLFKDLKFESKIITNISTYSFGIYFIHLFFIMFLNKVALPLQSLPLPVQLIINTFLVLTLSYTSIILLKRVPTVKKYIE